MAFILDMVTPKVVINGYPYPARWGRNAYDLPPGPYDVTASFPYMFQSDAGLARLQVPVYAQHATIVLYEAPTFMWSPGTMRVTQTIPMQMHIV
jgi:hypothetical protein